MVATTAVNKWFGDHKDAAQLIAEESAKDEMEALKDQISSVENETEELATSLRNDNKKMMEIMRECEPLQVRQKDLEDQLEGVAPSMEDVNAYAFQAVLQDLVEHFARENPYHIHLVIPGKTADGNVFGDVLAEIIDAPRTKTTGKSFLRITGSEINYVGSFRECVTQLYEANHSCKLRYATRQLAAEEARTNEKSGNEILVQKMGARMKISTMLSDLYDPRMSPIPWGISNVVEVGRTKPDGTDSVEMTARLGSKKLAWIIGDSRLTPEMEVNVPTVETIADLGLDAQLGSDYQSWLPWMSLGIVNLLRRWRQPRIRTIRRAMFKLSAGSEASLPWEAGYAPWQRHLPMQALYRHEPSRLVDEALAAFSNLGLTSINDLTCCHPDAVSASKAKGQPLFVLYRVLEQDGPSD